MDIFTEQLLQQINESHVIARDSIKLIVHLGSVIVAEKYIQSQMPWIGYQWFQDQVKNLAKKHYISNDDYDDTILEDDEPNPVNIDHWRRCQGQVALVKSQEQSPIRRSETKKLTKISMGQTQSNTDIYECQIIKMGELDEDIEFDPNIESMRQAKLRQMQIQQLKQQNDKIKNQEVQEQTRQLKRLNVDSKSKYTYDFEGKVIVQKPPDIDRYPKSHQNIQEKRNLVEVRDLIPNHKLQSELITSGKRQSAYLNSMNQFAIKTTVPQIDIIVMKEGVSFYDGKSEKKKERPLPLMDIKDNNELQNTLLNQNVHMTKLEYQTITNSQQSNNNFQNKTLQLSISQPQIQQSKTSRTFQEDQPQTQNNDSLLSFRQPKTTVNHSITSNILQKLNGSISILSEEQLDGLIVQSNDINKQKEHPLFMKKPTIDISKPLQPVPTITLELPQIPPNALSNSVSKLPRSFQSIGTFPKLLSKHPRERISKQVMNIINIK
ncbi:unnamed protein product [Paramecium pentaurelia]|uniref:Uncharacterized protein n=1 Tax=Paramecium pentaurelia TaxID=43138 RepID=A0A8S1X5R9_9CILI|nr:unnamed protein product [Paramecium pentaurelia]